MSSCRATNAKDQLATTPRVTTEWSMVAGSTDEWSRLLDGWMLLVAKDWVGRRYLWSAWAEPEDDMPTHAGTADSLAAAKSAAERSIGERP